MKPGGTTLEEPRTFLAADTETAAERRRSARVTTRSLHSSVGRVLDLSRTGMRVLSSRRLRGEIEVVLLNRGGPHLKLLARVVWSERLGFRKHLVGLELVNVSEQVASHLAKISVSGGSELFPDL